MNSTPVAFFDFDGTLTTGDTLLPFLRFVVGSPVYYAKLVLLSPVLGAYAINLLRNDIAKQVVLRQFLAGRSIEELFELGKNFSTQIIPAKLRPAGIERLSWHLSQGHDCVLVSASLDVYLEHWGKYRGFKGIIASSLRVNESGAVTGNLRGENCFGPEKARRIRQWLMADNRLPETTYAYGDSRGDSDMLDFAEHAFFVKE